MEELIVSVASLVVLVPIIYYLPLGITNKGKLLIVIAAFIFANIGMIAAKVFPLWQVVLIILLLTLLTVYILDKRLNKVIFSNAEYKEDVEVTLGDFSEDDEAESTVELREDEYRKEIAGDLTIDDSISLNQDEFDIEEAAVDDVSIQGVPQNLVNENKGFVLSEEDSTMISSDGQETDSTRYLSEIEKLLEEEEKIEDKEFILEDITDIDKMLEEEFEDDIEEVHHYPIDHVTNEVAASLMIQEEEALVNQEIGQDNSNQDATEILLSYSADTLSSDNVYTLENVDMESEIIADESSNTKQEQRTLTQQQLFHTMVSQLRIARKKMSPRDYEALVKEHFHPNLAIHDYYTFASLLIEHYISRKEIGKLKELLTNLNGKLEKFPILDMEIHYLYKQYCEKHDEIPIT